ncbi:MAG: type II toxin-antitoxin system VapC family toxin [Bryobacterales bacterium]
MIILDTNVLSELLKPSPSRTVLTWFAKQPPLHLFTTTITQAEILYGLELLPGGRRRNALHTAIEAIFAEDFSGRILPFDSDAARAFPGIVARRRALGRPIAQSDAQIAAIAKARNAAVGTRNTADFEHCGVAVVDPWKGG